MDVSGVRVGSRAGWAWCAALLLALTSASCSCEGEATTGQASSLRIALERDESGAADYLLDFGVVAVGDREEVSVLVTNGGNAPLVIAGAELAAPFAHELPAPSWTIGVGAAAPLVFTFAPEEEAGPVEAILELTTNERSASRHTVRLIGTGMQAVLQCTPASLDFGAVPRGAARTLRTSCHNPLPIPVEIHTERIRGNSAASFSVELPGFEAKRATVPGEGAIEVELRFQAHSLGVNDAHLSLDDAMGQPLASIPLAAQVIDGSLYAEPTDCLDFSYVDVGEERIGTFSLRAIGDGPLQVRSVSVTPDVFKAVTELPIELSPGGAPGELAIAFRPTENGARSAAIAVEAVDDDAATRTVTLCARGVGVGGGPTIACTPAALDFGQVAVGMSTRRIFACVMDVGGIGDVRPGPVVIETVRSSSAAFEPILVNQDGSRGPKAGGYADGEGFAVEVAYAPAAERLDEASISLFARGASGALELQVTGQGRELEPCDFSIEPPILSFGSVDRGEQLVRAFTIRNHLSTSCLIGDLGLTSETDPSFAVTTIEGAELGGHQSLEIEVTFAPTRNAPLLRGAVEFQISNPDRPQQRVELSGSSGEICLLVEPADLDFGQVAPRCVSRDVSVSVRNVCAAPLTIGSIVVEGSDPETFAIRQRPVLPAVLRTNERREFTVAFQPQTSGIRRGTIAIEVEDSDPYRASVRGEAVFGPTMTDRFDRESRPKADILWVIDNSSSFGGYQELLGRHLPSFLAEADAQNVDYHLAVTTSGITARSGCPGGANGGENGRFFPIDGSHPRILTPETEDLAIHWAHNIKVGECHSTEKFLEAAYRALSRPLIEEAKDSRYATPYNDGNAGFLRKDASLSIIFAGNEEDQSIRFGPDDEDYVWYFSQAAGSSKLLRVHGIVGLTTAEDPRNCGAGWGAADRIRSVIAQTGGTWLSLCTPIDDTEAWTAGLRRMSEGVFTIPRRFYLRGAPGDSNGDGWIDEGDIDVAVDGVSWGPRSASQEVRWTYDPIANAIDFDPDSMPDREAEITATYSVGCGLP